MSLLNIQSDNVAPFHHEIIDYLRHTFEVKEHLDKVLVKLSLPPLFTTIRVPTDDDGNDAARCHLSENLLKQSESRGWKPFQLFIHPALRDCVIVKNRGPNQLQVHAKEVIVDVHCGMAVLRGADVFKQGILGAPHGLKNGDHVSVYADLDGKCLKGCASVYNGVKIHVGNGLSQVARSDLFNANANPSGVGILMTDPLYQAPSLANLEPALLFPQNLPSIVCTHALDPQPGEIILDLCAAPGGKTTHIASRMGKKGRVVALEKSGERAARMKEMTEKINCHIIETYAFDSTKAVDCNAVMEGGPPYPPGMFQRILVDAPCSALGQRPCLANRMSLSQVKSFPVVQHKLLCAAVQLLKEDGVLVYSTCTLPVEENEDQVHRILKKFPSLTLVPMPSHFQMGTNAQASSQLSDLERSKVMRFDPSSATDPDLASHPWDGDTIGFFLAKFQKTASAR